MNLSEKDFDEKANNFMNEVAGIYSSLFAFIASVKGEVSPFQLNEALRSAQTSKIMLESGRLEVLSRQKNEFLALAEKMKIAETKDALDTAPELPKEEIKE